MFISRYRAIGSRRNKIIGTIVKAREIDPVTKEPVGPVIEKKHIDFGQREAPPRMHTNKTKSRQFTRVLRCLGKRTVVRVEHLKNLKPLPVIENR